MGIKATEQPNNGKINSTYSACNNDESIEPSDINKIIAPDIDKNATNNVDKQKSEDSSKNFDDKTKNKDNDITNDTQMSKETRILEEEELKRLKLEILKENLKIKRKDVLEWVPSTDELYKNKEGGKEYKGESRRTSHYLHNIQMTNSSLGLTFNGSEKKDAPLMSDSTTVARFSPVWKQTLASTAPTLLIFVSGLTSGYSAILLPQLMNDTSQSIPSDENTRSWIAAMAALPMAPGCLVAGWMLEMFGRRKSLFIACLPLLLGWICIACSFNLTMMLVGRFLTGFVAGLFGPLVPVYIGETTEPKYRGFFLAGVSLAVAFGILVVHTIGTFIAWQWTAAICAVFPVLSFVLLTLVPESPTWLISKGRTEEGVKAFYWLRGYDEEAKSELMVILDRKRTADSLPKSNWKDKLSNFKSPELMKPLGIMFVFFCTCQFSGVNAVAFYSIEVVERSVGEGMDHYLVMLVIDLLRFVVSLIACVTCKKYGRRPLCFISGICTALSMFGLSMFLYWKPENMSWLPLLCLLLYICSISIGLVPLPWIMCGELFPTRVRGLGSGISSSIAFVAFFAVVKTAPHMMSHFGEMWTFLFYGIVAFIGTTVLFFILPETKGKSLQEIEDRFKKVKSVEPKV